MNSRDLNIATVLIPTCMFYAPNSDLVRKPNFVLMLICMALALSGAFVFPSSARAQQSQPLSNYEIVRRAMQFSTGPVGVAAVRSQNENAFRELLRTPSAARDFRKLLTDATTCGQLYGLLGLKLLNDPAYAEAVARYKASRSQVSVAGGCMISNRPVAEIAKYIDSGEMQ